VAFGIDIIMSTESLESRRLTRFPRVRSEKRQQPQSPNNLQDEEKLGNRRTLFPRSLNHDFTLLMGAKLEEPASERQSPKSTPPRIPLTVNIGNVTPHRSISIDQVGLSLLPMI
jgi:hypothetical protein